MRKVMNRLRTSRAARALALAALAALASTATAAAGTDQYTIHRTTTGDAAARAVALMRPDVGSASGWSGGSVKPDLTSDAGCPNYHPKRSDLVVTGAAASDFKHLGLELHSETQIMQTPKMVQVDWQRSLQAPHFLECARASLKKALNGSTRFVSLKRIDIPKLTTYTAAYRAVFAVKTAKETVSMAFDVVYIGRGKTEITLTTTTPVAAIAMVWPMEVGLAGTLAGRIRA